MLEQQHNIQENLQETIQRRSERVKNEKNESHCNLKVPCANFNRPLNNHLRIFLQIKSTIKPAVPSLSSFYLTKV